MEETWRASQSRRTEGRQLKEELDQAQTELERAQRDGDWSRAGELTYSVIRDLKSGSPRPRRAPRPSARRSGCAMSRRRDALDRHPGRENARSRAAAAQGHGGEARRARRRPARRGAAVSRAVRRPAPGSRIRTGRPARSCSSGRPASARPNWPKRWPSSCSTTRRGHPARHVGVHGAAHGLAHDRLAAGLCRL